MSVKVGRNEPCPCGSGKKLKKCCRDLKTAVLKATNKAVYEVMRSMRMAH